MVAGRAQTLDAVSDATSQLRSSGRSDLFHMYLRLSAAHDNKIQLNYSQSN